LDEQQQTSDIDGDSDYSRKMSFEGARAILGLNETREQSAASETRERSDDRQA
jgi:hypothetical protein